MYLRALHTASGRAKPSTPVWGVSVVLDRLSQAHAGKAWRVLGYRSWREFVNVELNISRRHSYRLLDQAQVIESFADFGVTVPIPECDRPVTLELNEWQARYIKPMLPQARADIEEAIAAGEEPHQAIQGAIAKYRNLSSHLVSYAF